MLTLLKNAQLYAPAKLGQQDVLIADGRIAAIEPQISLTASEQVAVLDLQGKLLVPGFVDPLVHFIGGGGEGGFANRTPELSFAEAAASGVTTLIGALGTDSVTRSPEQLLGKARELNALGLSAYIFTGSYHLPLKTICGSVERDIVLLPEVLGIGEVAIADHRGSHASTQALIEAVSEARVAGLLAGKRGVSFFHVGDGASKLQTLRDILAGSELAITQLYPTHCNRNRALFAEALAFMQDGGYIDLTTSTIPQFIEQGEVSCAAAIAEVWQQGLAWQRLTLSSDANASLPLFDESGNLQGLQCGRIDSLFEAIVEAVNDYKVPLEVALATITHNPAEALGLSSKGRVEVAADADLVVLDAASLAKQRVIARGQTVWKAQSS